jgi:hypothetical protein
LDALAVIIPAVIACLTRLRMVSARSDSNVGLFPSFFWSRLLIIRKNLSELALIPSAALLAWDFPVMSFL